MCGFVEFNSSCFYDAMVNDNDIDGNDDGCGVVIRYCSMQHMRYW